MDEVQSEQIPIPFGAWARAWIADAFRRSAVPDLRDELRERKLAASCWAGFIDLPRASKIVHVLKQHTSADTLQRLYFPPQCEPVVEPTKLGVSEILGTRDGSSRYAILVEDASFVLVGSDDGIILAVGEPHVIEELEPAPLDVLAASVSCEFDSKYPVQDRAWAADVLREVFWSQWFLANQVGEDRCEVAWRASIDTVLDEPRSLLNQRPGWVAGCRFQGTDPIEFAHVAAAAARQSSDGSPDQLLGDLEERTAFPVGRVSPSELTAFSSCVDSGWFADRGLSYLCVWDEDVFGLLGPRPFVEEALNCGDFELMKRELRGMDDRSAGMSQRKRSWLDAMLGR